ncbi:MFS transporter [Fertoebacter nigrum]|uniref:MFS transporter n=1 Tax=Fertoeibacter niger TaxID=2656921 RepID=A0A8X8KQ08_9RHOB|nr:MFS transporter [Fertoeibacter niger]NUB46670.1 MFS transporter [Fertoeibacter niger]
MATRYLPLFLKHAATPRVESFALLAGLEAAVRGTLIAVMPLTVYDAVRDAGVVSRIYFFVGIASLIWGLLVPWATRHVPRRWLYTLGTALYVIGMVLAIVGGPVAVPLSLLANALATATVFVCFNAYVLDYITRADLGRSQSMQMLYAATPWAVGPLLGVWLRDLWAPAPFLLAAVFAGALATAFWVLRLGNGKQITRAKGPALNPLAYLGRFAGQPRLIAGWLFAVLRSCGWWVYVVYLPIFCIEAGLGDKVGGVALSLSNALLFTTPLLLRMVYRRTVRVAVRGAFALCAVTLVAATLLSGLPWLTVLLLMACSFGLVLLDVAGGLPFMMAVKPSERTEMAAVYSSFRDVSGILTPGAAYLVLLVAPVAGVFAACGAGMAAAWLMAGRLHPRLGAARPSHGVALPGE